MKPHTTISAILEPLLRQRLEQQGVVFAADDFKPHDFLVELRVTEATHAIAFISVLEQHHRKVLKAVRKANPHINIIIIAGVGALRDKKLMDVFAEFNVRVVRDGSHNLVESIVKIIEETSGDAVPGVLPDTLTNTTVEQPTIPDVAAVSSPSVTKPRPPIKLPDFRLPKVKVPQASLSIPAGALQVKTEPAVQAPVSQPKQEQQLVKKKSPRLPRPLAPVVIPIFGGSRGVGCTWLAIQIGCYIAEQGHAVAVCGDTDLLLMGPRYVRSGDTRFTVKGIDIFPYLNAGDVIRGGGGYDYIVFDVGLVLEFEPDGTPLPPVAPSSDMQEIMRAPCPIMVTDIGLWRQSALMLVLTNRVWKVLKQKAYFTASCRASQNVVNALERQYQIDIVRLPVAEPFDLTAEVITAVELLLQPLLI
ncbi:MAG TPA: hypothetical protein VN608_09510 [Clostridia bacterium]|nr:hypothetical protein [Clostridia bacterium]